MSNQRGTGGLAALAAAVGLCCGLPLLAGAGIGLVSAGMVMGSAAVVAVGAAIGVWGWRRRLHRTRSLARERQ